VHATIVECWKQLNDGNISAKELLKRCDKVNFPIKYDVVCVICPVNVLIVYTYDGYFTKYSYNGVI
jgi:hypothetical protein